MSPTLAADVASRRDEPRRVVTTDLTLYPHRRSPSRSETSMHVLAAIGCFAVGCLIGAVLPRPLEQDKRAWRRVKRGDELNRDQPPKFTRTPPDASDVDADRKRIHTDMLHARLPPRTTPQFPRSLTSRFPPRPRTRTGTPRVRARWTRRPPRVHPPRESTGKTSSHSSRAPRASLPRPICDEKSIKR